jgi:hypothetical protein
LFLRSCPFIEGDRTFSLIYGSVTGLTRLVLAVPILWWRFSDAHRTWLFSKRIDPRQHLQYAYGSCCMTMAWTDFGCRAIAHPFLPFVFALGLGPTVVRRALLRPRAEVGVRKAA